MARDLKEAFFRLDGAWASFELGSIRRRDDYLKPFRVLRCKIDDQVDFQNPGAPRSTTEASVLIEIFGHAQNPRKTLPATRRSQARGVRCAAAAARAAARR
jgi:hypothetical protein